MSLTYRFIRNVTRLAFLALIAGSLPAWAQPPAPTNVHVNAGLVSACTTTVSATPSQATFLGYANGTVVCLTAGSYTFNYTNATTRTGYVTFQSASARGANITLDLYNTRWIDFNQVTFSASGTTDGCPQHNKFRNFTWSPNVPGLLVDGDVCGGTVSNQDLTIDGGTFANVQQHTGEGRLYLKGPHGLTVTNTEFTGEPTNAAVAADGIQFGFGADNMTIGPGNYFHDLYQDDSSGPHIDGIQCFNSAAGGTEIYHIEIVGNYFADNSVHLGFYDGACGGLNIHNNVLTGGGAHGGNGQGIQMGGLTSVHFHHNTAIGETFGIGTKVGLPQNAQWIFENNDIDGGCLSCNDTFDGDQNDGCGSDCIVRFNLKSNSPSLVPAGTNNVTGTAVYTGALSHANWANYRLTSGSPGHNASNDGADMGTLDYGP